MAISANVSPLTSFVRALVKNPSCLFSYRSNKNFVITKPNTESPINSRVSNDPSKDSSSLSMDLCLKAFWYKSNLVIFVPTSNSTDCLSINMVYL